MAYGPLDSYKDRIRELEDEVRVKQETVLAQIDRIRELDALGVQHAGELAAAHEENARLREALRRLLDDSQHSEHRCGDPYCPVDYARVALGME